MSWFPPWSCHCERLVFGLWHMESWIKWIAQWLCKGCGLGCSWVVGALVCVCCYPVCVCVFEGKKINTENRCMQIACVCVCVVVCLHKLKPNWQAQFICLSINLPHIIMIKVWRKRGTKTTTNSSDNSRSSQLVSHCTSIKTIINQYEPQLWL